MFRMQVLIAVFQRHFRIQSGDFFWTIESVGLTVQVDYDTWPRYRDSGDSRSGPEEPAAIGVVTLTHDSERNPFRPWRAECGHPDGGEPVTSRDAETMDKALESLKLEVARR